MRHWFISIFLWWGWMAKLFSGNMHFVLTSTPFFLTLSFLTCSSTPKTTTKKDTTRTPASRSNLPKHKECAMERGTGWHSFEASSLWRKAKPKAPQLSAISVILWHRGQSLQESKQETTSKALRNPDGFRLDELIIRLISVQQLVALQFVYTLLLQLWSGVSSSTTWLYVCVFFVDCKRRRPCALSHANGRFPMLKSSSNLNFKLIFILHLSFSLSVFGLCNLCFPLNGYSLLHCAAVRKWSLILVSFDGYSRI